MLKYAITGHTSGIGKAIYEKLFPNIVGFSRRTGYDITSSVDRKQILKESASADVFINNACDEYGQTDILLDFFDKWKDLPKTIINVGSRITEITLPVEYQHLIRYQIQKKCLKMTVLELQGYTCKVDYKWFGYVGTERILNKYPHFTNNDYISIDTAVNIILNDKIGEYEL